MQNDTRTDHPDREHAGQRGGLNIAAQIAAIERDLARGAGPVVIDLARPSPNGQAGRTATGTRTGEWPPRLVNWRRSRHPVLAAWPSANGVTLLAWCPWCQVWHVHGRHGADSDCARRGCRCQLHGGNHHARLPCTCPPGSGDGHRTAHCYSLSRSPLKATGYVIREVRP